MTDPIISTRTRRVQMNAPPHLGRLARMEGMLVDRSFGTRVLPRQVIMFDDISDAEAHAEHLAAFQNGAYIYIDDRMIATD
jgi:hypothetical protein